MQFLKKNYEKFLLGAVLAAMVGVLVFMLFYIAADKEAMDKMTHDILTTPAKPLPDLDQTTNKAAIARFESGYNLDFETGNKLFNPFEWQKTPDGRMIKKAASVAQVAVVTNITPLYLVLTLDSVMTTTNESGTSSRYVIGVEKQAEKNPAKRSKHQRYVSQGDKANDTFELLEVKGAPENPDALIVKLVDSGETVTIARDQAYRRVDGYMADLYYTLDKKVFQRRREGDKVSFGGTDYLVFEINQNELILSDQSNQKKTPLPFVP
jgi:hypothetical protein